MTADQKTKLNLLFNEFDLDANGTLDYKEFSLAMKHTNNELSDEEIKDLF